MTISWPSVRPVSTSMSVAPVMPVVTGTNLARSLPVLSLSSTKTPWTGALLAAGGDGGGLHAAVLLVGVRVVHGEGLDGQGEHIGLVCGGDFGGGA